MKNEWQKAQKFELDWQKAQQFNSYNEETKQYIYASKMGLDCYRTYYFNQIGWDFKDKTVVDIGGGGQSILLKSKARLRTVVDPLAYSDWIRERYEEAEIEFVSMKAEDFKTDTYDIALIYNCLQHTEDPAKIIKNARAISKVIHIWEWIDTGISEGHIHNLTEKDLNKWLGGKGRVENLNQFPAVGKCYYGVFKGDNYEK